MSNTPSYNIHLNIIAQTFIICQFLFVYFKSIARPATVIKKKQNKKT